MFYPGSAWFDVDGTFIQAHGGGILKHGNTYYWFGENKDGPNKTVDNNNLYRVDAIGMSCYSSTDLYHWHSHGVVLPAVPDDATHDLHPSRVIERPKVLYHAPSQRFVMWMHVDSADYLYARIGIAVAEQPTGPYQYLHSIRPFGLESRDMSVFQDDDGRAYVIFSSNHGKVNDTLMIGQLSDDYLNVQGECVPQFIGQYREAPAVFKHEGRYYMVTSGCTGWDPNEARWSVADHMLGKWELKGNPCIGPDAHLTFGAQSTFVLPLQNSPYPFLFMADRWNPLNLRDSQYVWLPLTFEGNEVVIAWTNSWQWQLESTAAMPTE
jgi:hypothetical protein